MAIGLFSGTQRVAVLAVPTAAGTTVGLDTDSFVVFTGNTTQTYTLPACATGRVLILKNRSTGAITVNRASSDTIDGGISATLNANDSVTLIGNGTDWTVN